MKSTQYRPLLSALAMAVLLISSIEMTQAQKKSIKGFDSPLSFGSEPAAEPALKLDARLVALDAQTAELQVTVTLPQNYYIYSMDPAFSARTAIRLTETGGLVPTTDTWQTDRKPKAGVDPILEKYVEKFYGGVTWSVPLKTKGGPLPKELTISGELTGQYCSSDDAGGGSCVPVDPPEKFTAVLTTDGSDVSGGTLTGEDSRSSTTAGTVILNPQVGEGEDAKKAPVRFEISLSPPAPLAGSEVTLQIHAILEDNWHIFALDQDPEMAGVPTKIELNKVTGLELIDGTFTASKEPEVETPLDDIVQRVHYREVTWSQKLACTALTPSISGSITFQLCSHGNCLLPSTVEFAIAPPEVGSTGSVNTGADVKAAGSEAYDGATPTVAKDGLFAFLLAAAGAGFVALLTPCVFPMIPVTVAFFLKQEERKAGSSLGLALVYCLSIIAAFTVLGLLTAAIFGPTSLTAAANNRWLNLGFSALFLYFGLMLMGLLSEITIPSWLLTWSAKREAVGGMVGVIFMALTFTLVSFTCTFAFVGGLLILAAQGTYLWPIVGMLAFSSAFASPFFVLAMFPSMLKQVPKSGGWMNDVKVSFGLIELALVLKFLSVADIGFSATRSPRWITYQVFIWSWAIIAAAAGLFLLAGLFRKSRASGSRLVNLTRTVFALSFLGFAAYLTAGLFSSLPTGGSVWRLVAAFAPPDIHIRKTENLGLVITHSNVDYALEFEKAVASASADKRPLFVDFTGVNCVNCRQMERTVLSSEEICESLKSMVCAQLYTDEVPGIDNSEQRENVRQMNRQLQKELVRDATLPCYAILSSDGKTVLAFFRGLDRSRGTDFQSFIKAGQERWLALEKSEP